MGERSRAMTFSKSLIAEDFFIWINRQDAKDAKVILIKTWRAWLLGGL
jgi:hypothetical protein